MSNIDTKTAGSTEEMVSAKASETRKDANYSVDEEHIRNMSTYIRHSWRGMYLYRKMKVLLFLESLIWLMMDTTRAARMNTAKKLSHYKKSDRE